jgi:hypothetical protein
MWLKDGYVVIRDPYNFIDGGTVFRPDNPFAYFLRFGGGE